MKPPTRRDCGAWLAGICAAALVAVPAMAQFGVSIAPPQPLNTNAAVDSGSDSEPELATDGQGTWIAVWQSREDFDLGGGMSTGTDDDMFFSRSTDNGATWTPPMPLNANAATDSEGDFDSDIATDGQGTWVVVWTSDEDLNLGGGMSAGTDNDIYYTISTDNGVTWSPHKALNNNAGTDTGSDSGATIASDKQGTWIVTWDSTEPDVAGGIGSDWDLLFVRSTDNGQTWTSVAPLNSNAPTDPGRDFNPGLATDGQGVWVAAWESSENLGGTIGTDRDILFSRSTDNGVTWTPPAPANSNAATDAGDDEQAVVETDGAGNWLIVWWSYDTLDPTDPVNGLIGTDQDLLLVRSTDNGLTWSSTAPLNNNAATDSGNEEEPAVASGGHGHWVVVWYSDEPNVAGGIGTDNDILVARSTDDGATWTDPVPLNTNAGDDTGNDLYPALATDRRGNWVGAWASSAPLSTDSDILVTRFALPDCNGNGIGDGQEIAAGTSADCDANGIPDSCESDADADGTIDACDGCPADPVKTSPGSCGCGAAESDPCQSQACGVCGAGVVWSVLFLAVMLSTAMTRRAWRSRQ